MTDKERLEKIKEIDITPLCFYLDNMTNFDGKLLKEQWKWLINRVEELELEVSDWRAEVQKWQKFYKESEESHSETKELLYSTISENKRYKQSLEYIQRAIYTQHCTKNHKWNTEFEKGQMSGLIQASNIVDKAIRKVGDGID
jgi:hypothetical protein